MLDVELTKLACGRLQVFLKVFAVEIKQVLRRKALDQSTVAYRH